MEIVSLKRTKEEKAKDVAAFTKPEDADDYAYGLRVYLGTAEVKKLGLKGMDVAQILSMAGKVKIVGISTDAKDDGREEYRCELLITDLGLEPERPVRDAAESNLYPSMKKG